MNQLRCNSCNNAAIPSIPLCLLSIHKVYVFMAYTSTSVARPSVALTRPTRISICRCVDRKRVVYVPVILVIEHKARQARTKQFQPSASVRFSLSRFSWATLPRAGNVSLSELDNDEGNHNWLLVAIPPTRKIRKLDRRQVYRGSRFLRVRRRNQASQVHCSF